MSVEKPPAVTLYVDVFSPKFKYFNENEPHLTVYHTNTCHIHLQSSIGVFKSHTGSNPVQHLDACIASTCYSAFCFYWGAL